MQDAGIAPRRPTYRRKSPLGSYGTSSKNRLSPLVVLREAERDTFLNSETSYVLLSRPLAGGRKGCGFGVVADSLFILLVELCLVHFQSLGTTPAGIPTRGIVFSGFQMAGKEPSPSASAAGGQNCVHGDEVLRKPAASIPP